MSQSRLEMKKMRGFGFCDTARAVSTSDAINSKQLAFECLNSITSEAGLCPGSFSAFVHLIPTLDKGGPQQRFHGWLIRARRLGGSSSSSRPANNGESPNILPVHLPASPVQCVPPKGRRALKLWVAKRSAWALTEWLLSLFSYYELGYPKSAADYEKKMGSWHVSEEQESLALSLFEGLLPFCNLKSEETWSRGRKTLHEAVVSFNDNKHIHIGDFAKHNTVAAQYVDPNRISLPTTAGILDPQTL